LAALIPIVFPRTALSVSFSLFFVQDLNNPVFMDTVWYLKFSYLFITCDKSAIFFFRFNFLLPDLYLHVFYLSFVCYLNLWFRLFLWLVYISYNVLIIYCFHAWFLIYIFSLFSHAWVLSVGIRYLSFLMCTVLVF